jgi:hypothetical protein
MPVDKKKALPNILINLKAYVESEEDYMYLKIHRDDLCTFFSYNDHIRKRLEANNKVFQWVTGRVIFLIVSAIVVVQWHYELIAFISAQILFPIHPLYLPLSITGDAMKRTPVPLHTSVILRIILLYVS